MKKKLNVIKNEILNSIKDLKNELEIKNLEIKYLGRKGILTNTLKELKNLKANEKKEIGLLANKIKKEIEEVFDNVKKGNNKKEIENENFIDITIPGKKLERGHLHPLTLIQNELGDFFSSMGFMILDGPELESDYYNFEALNVPKTHPARDIQDTFYIDHKNKDGEYDMVMRTQTSPMQIRSMQKYGAPLKCVVMGRTFRCEALDACHEHTFDQMEGIMIDENISVVNLIAIMKEMISGIFKKEIEIRVRPGYFPFTEPGLEVDIKCTICGGKGCSSCKNSGWIEMVGSGMIHPKVLECGGIDPKKYSGFAFGIGLNRLAMMKYGIDNIRLFNGGDLRFLKQF